MTENARRVISHNPRCSAAQWLELRGTVRALRLRIAPLTGVRCVLYRVELTLLQRLRELRAAPTREHAGCRFVLRVGDPDSRVGDSRGIEIVVEPRAALLDWRGQTGRLGARPFAGREGDVGAAERLGALYERLGRDRPRGGVGLREWRLEPDTHVVVAGWLRRVVEPSGGEGGYRQAPERVLLEAVRIAAVTC